MSLYPERLAAAVWDRHRKTIEAEFHFRTLPQLQSFMRETHNFVASQPQYKRKFRQWGLKKGSQHGRTDNVEEDATAALKSRCEPSQQRQVVPPTGPDTDHFPANIIDDSEPRAFGLSSPQHEIDTIPSPPSANTSTCNNIMLSPTLNTLTVDGCLAMFHGAILLASRLVGDNRPANLLFEACRIGLMELNQSCIPGQNVFLHALVGIWEGRTESWPTKYLLSCPHTQPIEAERGPAILDLRITRCRFLLGALFLAAGDLDQSLKLFKECRDDWFMAHEDDDTCLWAPVQRLHRFLYDIHCRQGNFDEAAANLSDEIEGISSLGEPYLHVVADLRFELACLHLNDSPPEWRSSVPKQKIMENLYSLYMNTPLNARIPIDPWQLKQWALYELEGFQTKTLYYPDTVNFFGPPDTVQK